jgi:hypothetical protein
MSHEDSRLYYGPKSDVGRIGGGTDRMHWLREWLREDFKGVKVEA